MRWIDDLSADIIIDAVQRIFRLKGGPGIRVTNSATGITIALEPKQNISSATTGRETYDAQVTAKANNTGGSQKYRYTIKLGRWDESAGTTGGTFVETQPGKTFDAFGDASFSVNDYISVRARGVDTAGKVNYTVISGGGGGGTITGLFTSNAAGKGKYFGKSFTDPVADVSAITDLAEGDFGTLSSTEDCLILVPPELGVSNTGHDITNTINTAQFSLYFTGRFVRTNGDGKKVVHVERLWAGCAS